MTMAKCPVAKIFSVEKHPNADTLDIVKVLGYNCVDKKGNWKAGDLAVYVPIDSLIDTERPEFRFLKKNGDGKWHRLRTVRLRGVISQGILLKAPEGTTIGDNAAEFFGVEKYEPPEESCSNDVLGPFPGHLPKTDIERWQNYPDAFDGIDFDFIATEKVEGSSCTAYLKDGHFGVCSRNMEIKESDGNAYWMAVKRARIKEVLDSVSRLWKVDDLAIQGEVIGPKIQGNLYGLKEYQIKVFDFIVNGEYESQERLIDFCSLYSLSMVPVHYRGPILRKEKMVEFSNGPSYLNWNVMREGLVWRPYSKEMSSPTLGRLQLKVISPEYLLGKK